MLISIPGRDQSTEAWVSETFAAVSRVPVGGPDPIVWPFTPFYSGNPYQSVLYGGFLDESIVAAPTFRATDLRRVTIGWPADLPLVVHVHWLNQVLSKAEDDAQATEAVAAHAELLDLLKSRGAKLVWTIHNVLPHDTRFEAHEVRIRQDVVERADLIHVMSPRTPAMLQDRIELPADRLYRCDHPGYHGVYPDWVTRADARRRLRVPDGATALLLTGALKPYKGMAELLDAVDTISQRRPGELVLLVAGKPDDAPETQEFVARATAHPAVRLLPGQIPDVDMQTLFRAADVVALPYRRSLNSGVLALALTYGRPVLLPTNSGSLPLVDDGAALVYDAEAPGALVDAVERCMSWDLGAAGVAAAAAGQRIERGEVTRRFARELRDWADTGVVPTGQPIEPVARTTGPEGGPAAPSTTDDTTALRAVEA